MERFLANTHAVVVTAAEYMNFMRLCEDHGCLWNAGQKPTEFTPGWIDSERLPYEKSTIYFRKDGSDGMIVTQGTYTGGYQPLLYKDLVYDDFNEARIDSIDGEDLMCVLTMEEG